MSNKLFDIIPPQYNKSPSRIISPKKAKNFKMGYLIFILIVFLCLGAYFLIQPTLNIDLWPNLVDDHYTILVHISTSTSAVDFQNLSIPGSLLTKEDELSKEFSASKKTVQNKAQGIIRVYNSYSAQPITLIKNTRFMSSSGKIFLATSKFTIPGKPLYKDVKVVAAEAGKDYNIKPSSFSIPGLRGTSLYTSVYGKSFQTMSGGYVGEIYRVTNNDLTKAQRTLTALASQKVKEELLNDTPENLITINSTISCSLEDFFPLAEVGQEVSSFTAKVKVKSTVLSFKKEDLHSLVKNYVLSKLPEGQTVDFNYLNFSFNPDLFNIIDSTIKVEINSHRYLKLNKESLKQRMVGCRKNDISSFILDFYPHLITPPQVRLFPFWSQKAPLDSSRIKINIHLKS